MVSEPNTERCASEETEPQRGWTRGDVPARTMGPVRRWIGGPTSIGEGNECQRGRWASREMDYEISIGWRGERNILYNGVETSP